MNKFQYISDACCGSLHSNCVCPNGFSKILIWIIDHMGCVSIATFILFHRRTPLGWLCASHRWRFSPFSSGCQTRGCTSRMFEKVLLHLSPCQIGTTSDRHQLIMHTMLGLSCVLDSISRDASFLIILVRCRCISVIIHRIEKKQNIKLVLKCSINKGSWGSASAVGACDAFMHAKQQLVAICVTICLSAFYLSFAVEWLAMTLDFSSILIRCGSVCAVRPRISYSIRLSCHRIIRQPNWNQFECF